MMQSIINNLAADPGKVFLLDGMGAWLSASFHFIVLLFFEKSFGLPAGTLALLLAVAAVYGAYSFCCYWFLKQHWPRFLAVICVANALYCCVTLGLMTNYYPRLPLWSLVYLTLEVIVICLVLFIEIRVLRALSITKLLASTD